MEDGRPLVARLCVCRGPKAVYFPQARKVVINNPLREKDGGKYLDMHIDRVRKELFNVACHSQERVDNCEKKFPKLYSDTSGGLMKIFRKIT